MARLVLLALALAAAANATPCTVRCCTGDWSDGGKNPTCTRGPPHSLVTVLHDASSGHKLHRCFVNEEHSNGCECRCLNVGDDFEDSEDGTAMDADTGAEASDFKLSLDNWLFKSCTLTYMSPKTHNESSRVH